MAVLVYQAQYQHVSTFVQNTHIKKDLRKSI